jgi:hypothetical protein
LTSALTDLPFWKTTARRSLGLLVNELPCDSISLF